MTNVNFSPTSDSSIVSVDGLSTNAALVNAIGLHIAEHGKPNKAKYFQFSDGTYDVIRARSGGGFVVRAPRGSVSSSAPGKSVDALEAYNRLDEEIKARRTQILSALNTEIEELENKLIKAREARSQLLERAEVATSH